MSRPLTVQLDGPDFDRLRRRASQRGVPPVTLAQEMLHESLDAVASAGRRRARKPAAVLDRIAALTSGLPSVDAVRVAADARAELDTRGPSPA